MAAAKKDWIKKAVNPAHKGFCTPLSKPTCTPKRKALAKTFKAIFLSRFSICIIKNGGKVMLKRADGSVSQRGLWDNLRAAKGSGKKPTAQMLKQEKKIKSQSKKK